VDHRENNKADNPGWFNAPVPGFGPVAARLLVVGLAPGLRGANRTGRPFTSDFAGMLLYKTLIKFGLASGEYKAEPNDGVVLLDCRLTNAVRCVPPQNLPNPQETAACNPFLGAEIASMPKLQSVLALGGVAHRAVLRACGLKADLTEFEHGAMVDLPNGLLLADSYNVSRLNMNQGRLTAEMFEAVVAELVRRMGASPPAAG
jgi:uracil-DNA glycosylase family 4